MPKESRSLENALNMTPELSSFLDGPDDSPKKKTTQKKKEWASPKSKSKPLAEPQPNVNARVSFSTRIRADIASKLFAVASKRRLENKSPWSKQGIAEVAIEEWLRKNS